jgi:hypothetical protein
MAETRQRLFQFQRRLDERLPYTFSNRYPKRISCQFIDKKSKHLGNVVVIYFRDDFSNAILLDFKRLVTMIGSVRSV